MYIHTPAPIRPILPIKPLVLYVAMSWQPISIPLFCMLLVCPASLMSEYYCSPKNVVRCPWHHPRASSCGRPFMAVKILSLVHPGGILAAAISRAIAPPKKKFQSQTTNNQHYTKTARKNFQFSCYFYVFLRLI